MEQYAYPLTTSSPVLVVGRPALSPRSRYTRGVAPGAGPTSASIATVRSLLAFAAHPDDVESWCAGALALAAEAGAAVRVVVATSGEGGTPSIATADLGSTREAEARAAAQILGIYEPLFLRLPDGSLAEAEALLQYCRDAVARYRPDLILTFDPDRPSSATPHSDHVAMGRTACVAAGDGVETWLFSTAAPNRHLDIGPVFERKVAARLAHHSQTIDPDRLRADWIERARDAGVAAGLSCAEAFRTVP